MEESPTISPMDKMSMELFMNNRHYSKYLSDTDPKKYEEFTEYRKTLSKYHNSIMDITQQLLTNPKKQWIHNISESFHHFAKSCIKYLENQELEQGTKDSYSDNDCEDEIMFDEQYMINKTPKQECEFPKSFWGKQVHKQLQTSPVAKLPLKLGWDQSPPQQPLQGCLGEATIEVCPGSTFVELLEVPSKYIPTANNISRDFGAFSGKKIKSRK